MNTATLATNFDALTLGQLATVSGGSLWSGITHVAGNVARSAKVAVSDMVNGATSGAAAGTIYGAIAGTPFTPVGGPVEGGAAGAVIGGAAGGVFGLGYGIGHEAAGYIKK